MTNAVVAGILKGVLAMELADGEIQPGERKLLGWLVERFGLEEGELADAVGDAKQLDAADFRSRLDHDDRMTVAQYACMAAYADGHLDQREKKFLVELEKRLGLNAKDVRKLEKLGRDLAKAVRKRPISVEKLTELVDSVV